MHWTVTAGITEGRVFRAINKAGRIWGDGISRECCGMASGWRRRTPHREARTARLAPHVARDCVTWRVASLNKFRFLLGHVSVQTTERYLGCKQKLKCAVNDRLGIEPDTVA